MGNSLFDDVDSTLFRYRRVFSGEEVSPTEQNSIMKYRRKDRLNLLKTKFTFG